MSAAVAVCCSETVSFAGVTCPYCGGRLAPHQRDTLKCGVFKQRFRCTCCQRFRSAYSTNGETWKWDSLPDGRPLREFTFA